MRKQEESLSLIKLADSTEIRALMKRRTRRKGCSAVTLVSLVRKNNPYYNG